MMFDAIHSYCVLKWTRPADEDGPEYTTYVSGLRRADCACCDFWRGVEWDTAPA